MNTADPALFSKLENLPPELWEDVRALPLSQVARCGGAIIQGPSQLDLPFLNGFYKLNLAAGSITPPGPDWPLDFQTALVLLTYLARSQEIGLAGRMLGGRELPGGDMFFQGVHALPTPPLAAAFAADPLKLENRALALGAGRREGGDLSLSFLALPKILLGLTFYGADEEFPAEAVYTFDAHIHHHLALDGILALTNVLNAILLKV